MFVALAARIGADCAEVSSPVGLPLPAARAQVLLFAAANGYESVYDIADRGMVWTATRSRGWERTGSFPATSPQVSPHVPAVAYNSKRWADSQRGP